MSTLYSIGYGNRQWTEVKELLADRECEFLIDVRSSPYSKFNPSFSKDALSGLCAAGGFRYLFMGDTLGGKPSSQQHFDSDGKVNYEALAKSEEFKIGLGRLIKANERQVRACIMCSELRPHECHRSKLIGAELKLLGIEVIHIDEEGNDLSQEEALRKITGGQEDMFGRSPVLTRSRGAHKK